MRCPNCKKDIERNWKFCPYCGYELQREGLFDRFFSRFFKKDFFDEFKSIDKFFERNMEAFDLSPLFKETELEKRRFKGPIKGFSIQITTGTGMEPKVNVKTFGDVDKKEIEKEVYDKLGIKKKPEVIEEKTEKLIKPPKVTEEPKANIKRLGSKVIVDLEIPDVKSEDEIEIRELENSVEVKAIAKDKAYFKILTKPAQFNLTHKSFKNGILHLEFS